MPAGFSFKGPQAIQIAMVAGMKEMVKQAEIVLTLAIDETPKDKGDLRRSGKVTIGDKFSVYVSFDTKYARRQHEEVGYNHTEGKAKYLEDPFKARKIKMEGAILRAIKDALKNAP